MAREGGLGDNAGEGELIKREEGWGERGRCKSTVQIVEI